MRILIVSQHYKPEPFNVSETSEELVRRGHDVTVLTALPNCPGGIVLEEFRHGQHRDEVDTGVRVVRVPIVARGKDLHGMNKLRRAANYVSFPLSCQLTNAAMDSEYDCVLCFQFSPILMAVPALRMARRQGVPCLLWSFDLWPEDMLTGGIRRSGVPYRIMRRVSRRIYASADMVAVTSPGFEKYFSEQLGLQGLKTRWLPQFAEDVFGDVPSMRVSGGDIIFTFAGNVGGNQAVETVVRAASLLKDDRILVRIVGSGSRLEACKHLAADLRARNVEFLGRLPLESMPRLYADSDAMILTLSRPQGDSLVPVYTIPRKFQSYIAAGRPVLCSAEGTVAEIVRGEGCGIACPAEDAEGLAEAMERFARMPRTRREEMGTAARGLYERRYSRDRFFADLETLLSELTGRK
ncbi:MAG TPA: glycosyltransferase family 4 protein [Collinsella ihuae]|uniref:Glycosyltransferase family 4 protein n=1 Tax=Collinsella ihumii TaxID=1720204 RepID=A0A921INX5_9ACTN|nr:glycosyltransferase family 4 protein [Collinsella ihumii]